MADRVTIGSLLKDCVMIVKFFTSIIGFTWLTQVSGVSDEKAEKQIDKYFK